MCIVRALQSSSRTGTIKADWDDPHDKYIDEKCGCHEIRLQDVVVATTTRVSDKQNPTKVGGILFDKI